MRKSFLYILMIVLWSSFSFSQQKILDSILPTIKTPKDSVVFDTAMVLLKKIWRKENYDTALTYQYQLITLSKKISYTKGIGDVYNQVGNIYNLTHQNIKAFHNYDTAVKYYKLANHQRGLAIINNNKSTIEQGKGNLESAINYILKANLYFERIKDSTILACTYNNIANIYSDIGNTQLAKEYYIKPIKLKRKNNSKRLITSLNNLALLYIAQKKTDSAKTLLIEALHISKSNHNSLSTTLTYNRLGSIELEKKEYQKATQYYDSAYIIAEKSQNKKILANTKQQLAIVSIKTKNYKEAQTWLTAARNDLETLNTTPLLLSNYKYAGTLDSARGDFKSAFMWQKKYQELSDAVSTEESSEKIAQAEARFKSEMEQLKRIDVQEKRELKAKEELFRYRIFTFISLGISVIFLIFLIFINKTRKERKKYIQQLNESNQVKNKLFSMISHDLKNEIHGLDSSLNLLQENTISTEEFQEIVPLLSDKTHQTSILLNNLLNWSKSQMKKLRAKPTVFDIKEIITDKFSFFEPKATIKNIKLTNKLAPTMVFADKDMFAIISQNLIANAIKFCNAGDTITLASSEKENHYEIYFKDTGIGIPEEHIHKLFAEETFTTCGTMKETGTGLGLKICKELIELNKGEIKVHSILGQGSTFLITLPKAS